MRSRLAIQQFGAALCESFVSRGPTFDRARFDSVRTKSHAVGRPAGQTLQHLRRGPGIDRHVVGERGQQPCRGHGYRQQRNPPSRHLRHRDSMGVLAGDLVSTKGIQLAFPNSVDATDEPENAK
jgi:hypothetical protein